MDPTPIVRLIVRNDAGRVLILRRASTGHAHGAWCLPGGKVDYGEIVEAAAARELREETALGVRDLRFLFYQDSLPTGPGEMHGINLYFEGTAVGTVALTPEASAYAWIGPADLDRYALVFRNDEGLRRYWAAASR